MRHWDSLGNHGKEMVPESEVLYDHLSFYARHHDSLDEIALGEEE